MPEAKRFEREPAEGSRRTVEQQLRDEAARQETESHPAESFPPFDDPAFSSKPAGSPVKATAAPAARPPADTRYADHPEFSQGAAGNVPPPSGMGKSEPLDDVDEKTAHSDGRSPPSGPSPATEQVAGAGPAIAERSKDARHQAERHRRGTPVEDDPLPDAPDGKGRQD